MPDETNYEKTEISEKHEETVTQQPDPEADLGDENDSNSRGNTGDTNRDPRPDHLDGESSSRTTGTL